MDYHLQRCEITSFKDFVNDRACMDAIAYTLIESIKCLQRASAGTKLYYPDLGIDVNRLSRIHVAIVKRGISPFELIDENYYVEELWSQIKVITDSTFAIAEEILK